jgi:hypothetical protein
MEKVSIIVKDHGSTVPKARGEKTRININIIKIILVINRFSSQYRLRI